MGVEPYFTCLGQDFTVSVDATLTGHELLGIARLLSPTSDYR